ncbi:recombinase family protein [Allohahella marinimesophila]|uniref:Recombinase family protein n=1 Tax=Allohahella marinimesophila TaxID=1054972 RepID=A0ABP7PVX6_9GAMM
MKFGYARVSTGNQDTALQMDALEAAGCERIYQETYSGKSRQRVELTRVLDILRAGDTLIVWRLDRLGRSLKDLVGIITELEQRQVGFKSLTESVDTTTAGGKLVFHLFGALAEFERSLIQERTKAGLEAARARGRKGGRPRKLTTAQIRMARAMLMDDEMTKAQVASHFGVSRPTLNKALAA